MVHPDVDVAAGDEARHRAAEHGDACRGIRQLRRGDAPLRLEALGQVGVGVEGNAIGPESADLRDGAREALRGLLGKAVDQVGVDRREAERARAFDEIAHALVGLHAVHGLLDGGIEVLHAEADAVEALGAQSR